MPSAAMPPVNSAEISKRFSASVADNWLDIDTLHSQPWLVHENLRGPRGALPFMHLAVATGSVVMLEFGLQNAAPLEVQNGDGQTVLQALLGSHESVWPTPERLRLAQALLDAGAKCDVRAVSGAPLWAFAAGRLPIGLVRQFLQRGAPVDGRSEYGHLWLNTLVRAAVRNPEVLESIEAVVQAGADLNTFGPLKIRDLPLFVALKSNAFALADRLLQLGARIDAADQEGRTALHAATSPVVVEWLHEKGAPLDQLDKAGYTPLGLVVQAYSSVPNTKLKELLLALVVAGSNLEVCLPKGNRPTLRSLLLNEKAVGAWMCAAFRALKARQRAREAINSDTEARVAPLRAGG